jgi:hypothetical protein
MSLKPCLRCGDKYSHFERWVDTDEGTVFYRVVCGACEFMPDHWEEDPVKAAEYWNYRPREDRLLDWIERAKKSYPDLENLI